MTAGPSKPVEHRLTGVVDVAPWPGGRGGGGYMVELRYAPPANQYGAEMQAAVKQLETSLGLDVVVDTVKFLVYGVEPGDEARVYAAVEQALRVVHAAEVAAWEEHEAGEPARAEEKRRAQAELDGVRTAFERAQRGDGGDVEGGA